MNNHKGKWPRNSQRGLIGKIIKKQSENKTLIHSIKKGQSRKNQYTGNNKQKIAINENRKQSMNNQGLSIVV